MRASIRILALGGAILVAPSARAQDDPADAVAEALFRDGRALMTDRRYPEACAKLAESQRIDPHLGTLLNLAACRVLEGRTATAWAEYREARAQASRAGRGDREAFAIEQLRALEPRLARVVIATRGQPPASLVLTLDGQQLEAGVLGTPLPVDPGVHQLTASAPGRAPWSTSFRAHEAAVEPLELPDLAPAEIVPAPVSVATPSADTAPPLPAKTSPVVWALGGLAIVGLGVGSYFGIETFVRNGDASSACPNAACSSAGLQADADARRDASVANVAFAVAGVAAVGAAVFYAVGRSRTASHVALTPGGLQWTGTW